MNFCITLPIVGPFADPRLLAELARVAEDSGWDAVFLEDYIVHYLGKGKLPVCDPWIALTAIALATNRVRIGPTVTPLSRRRPLKVARETVTLDRLSGGRLILGVGVGDLNDDGFGKVGETTNSKQRNEMLNEALQVLTGLWSAKPFSFEGRFYKVRELTLLPAPLQKPRIPIWIGGQWPHGAPVRRAARWDGICTYKLNRDGGVEALAPHEIRELKRSIEQSRPQPAPFDLCVGGSSPEEDPTLVRRRIEAAAEAGANCWPMFMSREPDAVRRWISRGPPELGRGMS